MEVENKHRNTGVIFDSIVLRVIGYTLLIVGGTSLCLLLYAAWNLYTTPSLVDLFANGLQGNVASNQSRDDNFVIILRLAAWPIAILLLLTVGKITAWMVEAGLSTITKSR